MAEPDETSLDLSYAEIREEMNRDPLAKALLERAELVVLARKQQARETLLTERIKELEAQRKPEPK